MASLVILSYDRPWNLEKSIPKLVKYKNINEILVLNGHPSHRYKNTKNLNKVKVFDDFANNHKYYASRRYIGMAEKATNDIIISLDDDELPSEALINNLVKAVRTDPNRLYGALPRACDKTGYSSKRRKDYNMVLHPMAVKKDIVKAYSDTELKKNQAFLKQTKGNGEDILFNHFYRQYTGNDPQAVKGKLYFMDKSNGYSSNSSHYTIRSKLCKRLSKEKEMETETETETTTLTVNLGKTKTKKTKENQAGENSVDMDYFSWYLHVLPFLPVLICLVMAYLVYVIVQSSNQG